MKISQLFSETIVSIIRIVIGKLIFPLQFMKNVINQDQKGVRKTVLSILTYAIIVQRAILLIKKELWSIKRTVLKEI